MTLWHKVNKLNNLLAKKNWNCDVKKIFSYIPVLYCRVNVLRFHLLLSSVCSVLIHKLQALGPWSSLKRCWGQASLFVNLRVFEFVGSSANSNARSVKSSCSPMCFSKQAITQSTDKDLSAFFKLPVSPSRLYIPLSLYPLNKIHLFAAVLLCLSATLLL